MEGDRGHVPRLARFNWQLHAGPSERRPRGMDPGSNALLKRVKKDASVLLSRRKCVLGRMWCPV